MAAKLIVFKLKLYNFYWYTYSNQKDLFYSWMDTPMDGQIVDKLNKHLED